MFLKENQYGVIKGHGCADGHPQRLYTGMAANDGRATYTAEDLMVRAENKYEVRLLDKENTWGKPTDEQEKIVAMTAEINSLKKEC